MTNNKIKSPFAHLSQLTQIPGNKAAIIRLLLTAVSLLGGLILTVCTLPPITDGFGSFLYAALTGIVCSIMFATLAWGFAKWTAFIFPKAHAVASRFWNSLYALGIFAFAIKVMVWLYLLMLPVVLYGIILAPLYFLVYALSLLSCEFLSVSILTLFFIGSLFFVVLLDICKLMDLCWKQTLRTMFCNTRQTVSQKMVALRKR